jgi:hypothetical protein
MKGHVQQSIWPVSVFGLGFLLLIMGLSGVASIQETRRIHQQILAVEDNYRHIENLVEGIRANSSQVTLLLRDRLLESKRTETDYSGQLAELRSKTDASLGQLSALRPQQGSKVLDRLEGALHAYLDAVAVEFRTSSVNRSDLGSVREPFQTQSRKVFAVTEELGKLNEENFESRRLALNE